MQRQVLCSTLLAALAALAACRPAVEDGPASAVVATADQTATEGQIAALEQRVAAGGVEVYDDLQALARELVKAGRTEDAQARYREMMGLRPETGAAYFELSQLAARTGDYDQAMAVADEGAQRVPEDSRLRSWYGEVLMKRGRWAEAEEVLLETLKLDGAGAYPHYVLGLVYLHTGKLAVARDELETATELQARVPEAWYQLAVVCERLGDLEARDRALQEFALLYRQRLGAGG